MMFENISIKTCDQLIQNQIIEADKRDIYEYGLHQGMFLLLNLAIQFTIGIILGMFLEAVILLMSYMILRIYAGGYHAKTQTRCCFISTVLFTLALIFINVMILNFWIVIGFVIFTGVCIFILAPCETENRPLNPVEVSLYKKKSRVIWFVEILFLIITYIFSFMLVSKSLFSSLTLMIIMLFLGHLQNGFQRKSNSS